MPNLIVFCNEDIIANITLNSLLPSLAKKGLFVHVFLSQKVSRKFERKDKTLSEFNFFTKKYMSHIFYPWVEQYAESCRGELLTFNQLPRYYPCQLHRIRSTKKQEDQTRIVEVYQESQPFLSLSVRNNLVIDSAIIKLAENYGCGKILNIHSSKLPEHAGSWCALRDMLEGQLYGSLHVVDEGIDTGGVIKVFSIPFERSHSYLKNLCLIYQQGAVYFLDVIDQLMTSGCELLLRNQDSRQRQYYKVPSEQEVQTFQDSGFKVFCFSEYRELLKKYLPNENRHRLSHRMRVIKESEGVFTGV